MGEGGGESTLLYYSGGGEGRGHLAEGRWGGGKRGRMQKLTLAIEVELGGEKLSPTMEMELAGEQLSLTRG